MITKREWASTERTWDPNTRVDAPNPPDGEGWTLKTTTYAEYWLIDSWERDVVRYEDQS